MFSERLNEFVASVGETPNSMERKIGVSKGTIYKAIKNGRTIGIEVLVKIFSTYPRLNLEWLVAGKGTMYKNRIGLIPGNAGMAEEGGEDYYPTRGPKAMVSLVNEKRAVNWDGRLEAINGVVDSVFYLPASWLPQGHRYVAFPVVGDSMEPTIPEKSRVLADWIAPEEYHRIQNGAVYVIITSDRIVIKRVTNRLEERGVLHVFSDNREYGSYDIPGNEIVSVWQAKALFSSRFVNEPYHLYRLYQDLEERIKFLEQRQES